MISILGHYVNKPVLVSIPPLFADGQLRACRLIGVESGGLWLESEDFTKLAFPNADRSAAKVFVPFTQIAYLVEGTTAPPVPLASKPTGKAPAVSPAKKRR
jgi:hypothetical protein